MKWKQADLQMAITLPYLSARTCNYLRKERKISLPAPSTLTTWAQQFTCSTGVLHEVILLLQSFLQKLPPRERLAVLCFDEMSVKQEVVFDKGLDKEIRPHKNVQVCMIPGLCSLY